MNRERKGHRANGGLRTVDLTRLAKSAANLGAELAAVKGETSRRDPLGALCHLWARAHNSIMWMYLGLFRDAAIERLYETWRRFDSRPPAPSEFAKAKRVFAERWIARVIEQRAELGPGGLDALRTDLVGFLRTRSVLWEDDKL